MYMDHYLLLFNSTLVYLLNYHEILPTHTPKLFGRIHK